MLADLQLDLAGFILEDSIHVVLHGVSCLLNEQPGYWNTQKNLLFFEALRQQDASTFRYFPCTDQSKAKWKKNITDIHTNQAPFIFY